MLNYSKLHNESFLTWKIAYDTKNTPAAAPYTASEYPRSWFNCTDAYACGQHFGQSELTAHCRVDHGSFRRQYQRQLKRCSPGLRDPCGSAASAQQKIQIWGDSRQEHMDKMLLRRQDTALTTPNDPPVSRTWS